MSLTDAAVSGAIHQCRSGDKAGCGPGRDSCVKLATVLAVILDS